MLNDDDATLLRAWTECRNEEAFRRLVDRYAGLVFGAARRRSGCEQMAAEATQDVFVRLAQRAGSIRRVESLPVWLHTAAVHAATDRQRKEARHQERMKRLTKESAVLSGPERAEEEPWREALPQLDEALTRLSETDRGIVLARYCQGESVAVAAGRFGLSAAAAQKRGERALEKLSVLLRRRGVTLSAALLGTGLSACLTQAVPEGICGKWSAAAVAAGKAGTAALWITFMNAKTLSAAAAVLAACVPVGFQLAANAKAHQAATPIAASGSKFVPGHPSSPAPLSGSAARPAVNGLDMNVLAREIRAFPPRQGRLQKELELRAVMLTLDKEQCAAVSKLIVESPSAGSLGDVVFELFSRWQSLDREGALAAAIALKDTPLNVGPESAVLHAWAEQDPEGMVQRFAPELGKPVFDHTAAAACQQAFRTWAHRESKEALNAALAISGPRGAAMVDNALLGWLDSASADEPLAWLEKDATPEQQELHYTPFIHYLADNVPDKGWASLLRWPNRAIAENEACSLLNMWAGHDPEAAVNAWLNGPAEWRDKHFAFNLAQVLAYSNPPLARRLSAEIPDPAVRETFAKTAAHLLERFKTE